MPSKPTCDPRRRRPRVVPGVGSLIAIAGLLPLAVSACTSGPPAADCGSGPAYTLSVLASSDLADMTPVLQQAASATGVTVRRTYAGSITGAQQVIDGTARRDGDQAAWLDSDNYLDLYPQGLADLNGTTEIMASPVVLAVRAASARRLGWNNARVTWGDVARAAALGEFTFGMADPAVSNAGLSALVSAATAFAGQGTALRSVQLPGVAARLTGMFHALKLTAPTSDDLAGKYLDDLKHPASGVPDGIIDYESLLLGLQARAPKNDPVTLIYPADGVLNATYPLSILAWAPPAAKSAWQRLACYLTSPQGQQEVMRETYRRPVRHGIPLLPALAASMPYTLPFPATPGTVTQLITAYQGRLRLPGRTIYALDTSASMKGARLRGLKQALLALTGVSHTLAGTLSTFPSGAEVTFLPFNYRPARPAVFSIPAHDPGPVLAQIRGYIGRLQARGRTAIYDSLVDGCRIMAAQDRGHPARIDSIVLLTDGENDWGRSLDAFLAYYRSLAAAGQPPPVYIIAVGDADLTPLRQVAGITGGALIDAVHRPLSDLTAIIQDVRGYQ